jgi:hypothetical protein
MIIGGSVVTARQAIHYNALLYFKFQHRVALALAEPRT